MGHHHIKVHIKVHHTAFKGHIVSRHLMTLGPPLEVHSGVHHQGLETTAHDGRAMTEGSNAEASTTNTNKMKTEGEVKGTDSFIEVIRITRGRKDITDERISANKEEEKEAGQ